MAKRKREPVDSSPVRPGTKAKKKASAAIDTENTVTLPDPAVPHPHGSVDYERDYRVRSIISERKHQYLIDWEDDEVTGVSYPPTWEPKGNANQLAIEDWESKKAAKANGASRPTKQGLSLKRKVSISSPECTPKRLGERRSTRRVIDSSPSLTSLQSTPAIASSSVTAQLITAKGNEFVREIAESPQPGDDNKNDKETIFPGPSESPAVVVGAPPASYEVGAYQVVDILSQSSLPASTASTQSQCLPYSSIVPSTANEFAAQVQQESSASSSSKVIPETQSQSQLLPETESQSQWPPESTFQGFPEDDSFLSTSAAKPPVSRRLSNLFSSSALESNTREEDWRPPEQTTNKEQEGEQHSPETAASALPLSDIDTGGDSALHQQEYIPSTSQPEARLEHESREHDATSAFLSGAAIQETADDHVNREPSVSQQGATTAPGDTPKDPSPAHISLFRAVEDTDLNEEHQREGNQKETENSLSSVSPENRVPATSRPPATPQAPEPESQQDLLLTAAEHSNLLVETDQSGTQRSGADSPLARENSGERQTSLQPQTKSALPTKAIESNQATGISEKDQSSEDAEAIQIRLASPTTHNHSLSPSSAHAARQQGTQETTAKHTDEYNTQLTSASTVQQDKETGINPDNYIVISSEISDIATTDFETPPNYNHQPSGQRPLPASYLEVKSAAQSDNKETTSSINESSFPFQTQIALSPSPESAFKRQKSPPRTSQRVFYNRDSALSPFRARSTPSALRKASTSIPPVPSRTLGTIGESAPAKFDTLLLGSTTSSARASMERASTTTSNSGESLPLAEKWRAMRERNRSARRTPIAEQPASALPPAIGAEVAAARLGSPIASVSQGTRSPSAVPAMEPVPEITKEEMNTSERYDTLLPQSQGNSSGFQSHVQNGMPIASRAVTEGEDPELANFHVVQVPLMAHQRDQYKQNLYWHRQTLEQFLGSGEPSEQLLADAESLIERLRRISMHPDLVNPETLSQVSTPETQAQWDVDASGKFHFLKELLRKLQERALRMHIAVAVHGDRAPDMIETFLQGLHIPYKRNLYAEAQQAQSDKSGLRVSIVDLDKNVQEIDNVDLVIAMDGTTATHHRLIRAFRRHVRTAEMSETNEWAMLLVLAVPHTIEHIERCMASHTSRIVRARVLLRAALRIESEAGRMEPGQYSRRDAAEIIAEYLDDVETTEGTEWPLLGLSMIKDLDSQTNTDVDSSSDGNLQPFQTDTLTTKRPFVELDSVSLEDAAKRPRLTPVPDTVPNEPATMNPQDLEITHISDSVGKATQTDLEDAIAPLTHSITEIQLSAVLQNTQDRLDDHVKVIEDLQYRFEDQHKELAEVKKTRDQAVESAQRYLQRMTLVETENTALRTERSELKDQLAEATRRLLDHSVPEQAEFEKLRLEAKQAQLDREKAEKRAETIEKDLDWTRSMYQDTSSTASNLGKENAALQARLAVALQQASGERTRAQDAANDLRWKALERETKKLRLMLRDREAGMKFRDEEVARLKESGRGRMGTRNSSVPRSPRLGSPMRAVRSRQASPAAGEPMRRSGSHLNPSRSGS